MFSVRPGTTKWNPGDIGYFDPNYEDISAATGDPVEHSGKDTYRDVYIFVQRVKEMVFENFQKSLLYSMQTK